MLSFHEHATANKCNTSFQKCQVKLDTHQIPFSFVHTTKELYEKGLALSDIGMYNVLASYLNFNAVVDMEGEKYLRGALSTDILEKYVKRQVRI